MAGHDNPNVCSDFHSESETDGDCEGAASMNNSELACTAEDAALERFLQQQRSDLMYELRRIQHGDRPVTGQGNRDNIASFMAKHQQQSSATSGKENVPANVDTVEEHRPQAVLVEMQGVVEQQRVSSVLQSRNFRLTLENIIRGSLSSARHSAEGTASRSRSSGSPRAATPVSVASRAVVEQRLPSPPELNQPGARVEVSVPASETQRVVPERQSRPTEPSTPNRAGAPEVGQERNVWDAISQVQHEELVYEISDLLHRRLVSTTLGSEFRGYMELHVQNLLSRRETDGEAVADFVRNIPQSQAHIPNDFRHLGIVPGPHDDGSDNISITGISATAVPYTQTNLHVSRELQSLKSQMEEMKSMLRLSFDLQMDIQRSIQQEVAAALASAIGQPSGSGATAAPVINSSPVNDTHCLICLESPADSVLYKCGHMCLCYACGRHLVTRGNGKCPVCRAPIKDVIRAYKTNQE